MGNWAGGLALLALGGSLSSCGLQRDWASWAFMVAQEGPPQTRPTRPGSWPSNGRVAYVTRILPLLREADCQRCHATAVLSTSFADADDDIAYSAALDAGLLEQTVTAWDSKLHQSVVNGHCPYYSCRITDRGLEQAYLSAIEAWQ